MHVRPYIWGHFSARMGAKPFKWDPHVAAGLKPPPLRAVGATTCSTATSRGSSLPCNTLPGGEIPPRRPIVGQNLQFPWP